MSFLSPEIMSGANWQELERAVARVLCHCGWQDVQLIGGKGDRGADILAVRRSQSDGIETFLIQVKAKSSGYYVNADAIDEAISAQSHYKTNVVVVATNADFVSPAKRRKEELCKAGFDVRLWNGTFLHDLMGRRDKHPLRQKHLRPYQESIYRQIIEGFDANKKQSLFIVATGLGKTIIAATAMDELIKRGLSRVLVLCHTVDLAEQLQSGFWEQLSKDVPTRLFMGGKAPIPIDGVNFGLYQTLHGYLGGLDQSAFDLIVVDEAHHAMAPAYRDCLSHLKPRYLIGMTATPWRGDGATINDIFGPPIKKVSLVDGMRMGYLAKVDYRLMCDNIKWERIPKIAKTPLSIRDLNRKLFVPQRDEAIIDSIQDAIREFDEPRILVFTSSKNHAEDFARRLSSVRLPCANLSVDDKFLRRKRLMDFSSGKLLAVTAVDVLNEGIDIPEVNILVFLRATHSRRIFVQQLGRGLRLSSGKEKVIVLDFVSDIRRLAAVLDLDREARKGPRPQEPEKVHLRGGLVKFNNQEAQKFVDRWLQDVADLQDAGDAEKLTFPGIVAT